MKQPAGRRDGSWLALPIGPNAPDNDELLHRGTSGSPVPPGSPVLPVPPGLPVPSALPGPPGRLG
ncbi:hypothetical protein [Kribbella catacumbae]|uniref:hypothetical protein n=1 Tax=Kribbella catacumbae TaxID=460086 RepID=UPI0003A8BB62|nr:hypothetical protein [Kribbella catacumbae]